METKPDIITKLNDETTKAFLDLAHLFHKEYEMVMKEYADKELLLRNENLDFVTKFIATIGLVAGFGFTGLVKVANIHLFILGEFFLFASIIYGSFKLKEILQTALMKVQNRSDELNKLYSDKSDVFQKYSKSFFRDKMMNATEFIKEVENRTDTIINSLKTYSVSGGQDDKKFINVLFIMVSIGGFSLLMSYILK